MLNPFFIYRNFQKSAIKTPCFNHPLYHFGGKDSLQFSCEAMNIKLNIIQSFDNFSWFDILFRRIRVTAVPSKKYVKTKSDKWKRRLLRYLRLDVRNRLSFYWLCRIIFQNHGHKTLLTNAHHVAQIYAAHLPDFNILEISEECLKSNTRSLYKLVSSIHDYNYDKSQGLTVFANIVSLWLIRAYRISHPNRRIVLRFHDLLDGQVTGNRISRDKIISIAKKLKQEGSINEIESYCRNDARDLSCTYRPNGVNPDF